MNVTRRVVPVISVTAVAVVVAVGPLADGFNWIETELAVIVPAGKFEPVMLIEVTPGSPAAGEAAGLNVTGVGA